MENTIKSISIDGYTEEQGAKIAEFAKELVVDDMFTKLADEEEDEYENGFIDGLMEAFTVVENEGMIALDEEIQDRLND